MAIGEGSLCVRHQERKCHVESLNDAHMLTFQDDGTVEGRFLGSCISDFTFEHWFKSRRRSGSNAEDFLTHLSPEFICFVAVAILHGLKCWALDPSGKEKGRRPDFKPDIYRGKKIFTRLIQHSP